MKICSRCGVNLELTCFSKRAVSNDGLSAACKVCIAHYKKNSQATKDYQKNRYWENIEVERARKTEWSLSNKEHVNKYKSEYRKKEPDRHRYWDSLKHAKRKQRVPPWLTSQQLEEINNFYWLAKDLQLVTGEIYQVDHIVPLLGKNICGLHVPWNLQILPSDLNNKKNNKFREPGFAANTGGMPQ
jgi:hypothetical protein